jgi:hypothetical protein
VNQKDLHHQCWIDAVTETIASYRRMIDAAVHQLTDEELRRRPSADMNSVGVVYHVGKIVMIARTVHDGYWDWLTIAPGESKSHNQKTWGTAASRSTFRAADQ